MKNSDTAIADSKQNKQNKTALDSFRLFYEEIPLELENRTIKPDKRPKDRLVRRSRARY